MTQVGLAAFIPLFRRVKNLRFELVSASTKTDGQLPGWHHFPDEGLMLAAVTSSQS